jgi:hypothetical protein
MNDAVIESAFCSQIPSKPEPQPEREVVVE